MKIILKKTFVKQYAKLNKHQRGQVDKAILIFQQNHALKGRLKGSRVISAANDLRIVFEGKRNYIKVYLLAVGTHNQVY